MTDHIQFDEAKKALLLLDQRLLPTIEETFVCQTLEQVIYALQTMVVRGAPAIGVTAGYGCYLCSLEVEAGDPDWKPKLEAKLAALAEARPTAVNLAWAVNRMLGLWDPELGLAELRDVWLAEAKVIHEEDIALCKAIGVYGGRLIDDGDVVLTHCNAGALATAGYGTALGVIRGAVDQGKKVSVIADETRPFLQGARLTSYELQKDGIPVRVACDNAVALLMKKGMVQKVVVGADRIAANGDAANKIGTYGVAIIAREFGVPFYVAAPLSTIDRNTADGDGIPIEERTPREVTHVGETCIVPKDMGVFNYAFDVTPNALIAGIVTEVGVLRAPYTESIKAAFAAKERGETL